MKGYTLILVVVLSCLLLGGRAEGQGHNDHTDGSHSKHDGRHSRENCNENHQPGKCPVDNDGTQHTGEAKGTSGLGGRGIGHHRRQPSSSGDYGLSKGLSNLHHGGGVGFSDHGEVHRDHGYHREGHHDHGHHHGHRDHGHHDEGHTGQGQISKEKVSLGLKEVVLTSENNSCVVSGVDKKVEERTVTCNNIPCQFDQAIGDKTRWMCDFLTCVIDNFDEASPPPDNGLLCLGKRVIVQTPLRCPEGQRADRTGKCRPTK